MEENESNNNDYTNKNNYSNTNSIDKEENKDNNMNKIIDEKKILYDSLIELFTKNQYKKILKLVFLEEEEEEKEENENEQITIINESEWMLSYLEIISIQKIIQKKNVKYYKSSNIPNFNEYIKKENKSINRWLLFINELTKNNNKEKTKCFLELIITFILQKCINLSKHCIYQEKYREAVCFLSLGINLINHSFQFFKSPESFILCGEIYLLLSNILLGDHLYETAENMISFSCKFFYMSMESILFSNPDNTSYSIFNILAQEENINNIISKILFYLSILFYNLGICYENQGFPYSSFYSYKQSKYFVSIINNNSSDIKLFYEYIKEIEKRQLMRNRIIIFFEKCVSKEDLIDKFQPSKKKENPLFSLKEKKEKKFNKLENYISNMNLIDVDYDEPYLFDKVNKHFKYNVNLATKQIHLLDYLMSNNFQEIINNMNKIRINKLDKETIRIIQRKIINIKNNEREKYSLLKNNKLDKNNNYKSPERFIREKENNYKTIKTASSQKTYNSCKKTRVSSSYKNSHVLLTDINNNSLKTESCFSFNSRPTTAHNDLSHKTSKYGYFPFKSLSKDNRNLVYSKTKSDKSIFANRNKLLFSSSRKTFNNRKIKYKIPKYSYDKYLFSKSFMKKKKILENQYSNEIIFQKQLLNCKKYDLIEPKIFNLKEIHNECDKFFFTTFEKEIMYAKERNTFFRKNDTNDNNNIKRKVKNNNNTFFNKQKTKKIIFNDVNNKSEYNNEIPNKNNYEIIDKLFNEIVYLNEKGKLIEKKYGKT